jgi:UPF0755 protein
MKKIVILCSFAVIVGVFVFLWSGSFSGRGETVRFSVPLGANNKNTVNYGAHLLKDKGVIKSVLAFRIISTFYGLSGELQPGAYVFIKGRNDFEVAASLKSPAEVWVVIPEGLRKEEISGIVGKKLNWSEDERQQFINYDLLKPDYFEGTYFPDTYLIPVNDAPADVALRLKARFNEELTKHSGELIKQNIKWTTALKIASIVQREAAGKSDMSLIAGIIWNRLLQNMKLDIDATLQYVRGDKGSGWWAPIKTEDKNIDSPYNTYLHAGLPPHPIDNPGADALRAVLNPQKTNCLYYLHDNNKIIHCSPTYEGHLANIQKYLK